MIHLCGKIYSISSADCDESIHTDVYGRQSFQACLDAVCVCMCVLNIDEDRTWLMFQPTEMSFVATQFYARMNCPNGPLM